MAIECTCSEDRNGGDPEQHTATCEWANAQPRASTSFTERAETYEQALDNLTEENWHTERSLIETVVNRYRGALERITDELSIDDAQQIARDALVDT